MEKEMSDNFVLLRELLETKMEHLNEKIDIHNTHVVERLDFIKEQTAKTNGRVTKAEEEIDNIKNDCARDSDIQSINLKIEKINEENLIVKVFNKYPRQLLSILVITVILSMLTMGYTAYKVRDTVRKIKSSEITNKYELPEKINRERK